MNLQYSKPIQYQLKNLIKIRNQLEELFLRTTEERSML